MRKLVFLRREGDVEMSDLGKKCMVGGRIGVFKVCEAFNLFMKLKECVVILWEETMELGEG